MPVFPTICSNIYIFKNFMHSSVVKNAKLLLIFDGSCDGSCQYGSCEFHSIFSERNMSIDGTLFN